MYASGSPQVAIAEHSAEIGEDDPVLERSFGHVDQVLRAQVQEQQAGQRAQTNTHTGGGMTLSNRPGDGGQDEEDSQAHRSPSPKTWRFIVAK